MKYFLPLLLIISFSCDDRKINASKWKEEMKTHKFVKVTNGEIAADVVNYAETVLSSLDSAQKSSPSSAMEALIESEEAKHKKTHKVKICYVNQDELDGCYTPITTSYTANDTSNKLEEIWTAYESAVKEKVAITNSPQFLLDGFYVLYSQPVIEQDSLVAMWCLLFERKNIVLNRIE